MNVFIHQPQPIKNRERAQRGLEKGLGAGGQRLAPGQAEQRADQDAQGVEESADHPPIVSRFGREGNEEKRRRIDLKGRE